MVFREKYKAWINRFRDEWETRPVRAGLNVLVMFLVIAGWLVFIAGGFLVSFILFGFLETPLGMPFKGTDCEDMAYLGVFSFIIPLLIIFCCRPKK